MVQREAAESQSYRTVYFFYYFATLCWLGGVKAVSETTVPFAHLAMVTMERAVVGVLFGAVDAIMVVPITISFTAIIFRHEVQLVHFPCAFISSYVTYNLCLFHRLSGVYAVTAFVGKDHLV